MVCRLDLLKLRYFWKLANRDKNSISNSVYKVRRQRFLSSNKGFLHEVFRLCCKYDCINIWHGICPSKMELQKINPLNWIKRVVTRHNLAIDIQKAKSKESAYSFLFLEEISPFQRDLKKYRMTKLFQKVGFFETADARKRFVKALLTTNPFPQLCKFCKTHVEKLLQHQLCECQNLNHKRQIFHMELNLYTKHGRQPIQKNNLNQLLSSIILEKPLLRCFTNFLQALEF